MPPNSDWDSNPELESAVWQASQRLSPAMAKKIYGFMKRTWSTALAELRKDDKAPDRPEDRRTHFVRAWISDTLWRLYQAGDNWSADASSMGIDTAEAEDIFSRVLSKPRVLPDEAGGRLPVPPRQWHVVTQAVEDTFEELSEAKPRLPDFRVGPPFFLDEARVVDAAERKKKRDLEHIVLSHPTGKAEARERCEVDRFMVAEIFGVQSYPPWPRKHLFYSRRHQLQTAYRKLKSFDGKEEHWSTWSFVARSYLTWLSLDFASLMEMAEKCKALSIMMKRGEVERLRGMEDLKKFTRDWLQSGPSPMDVGAIDYGKKGGGKDMGKRGGGIVGEIAGQKLPKGASKGKQGQGREAAIEGQAETGTAAAIIYDLDGSEADSQESYAEAGAEVS
ncbi:unnamed protein product [Symbiodinium necroappetens]|uniref:Uncharacterized protein n=1 Tax=Symbiodinium necroappetens TaxID=1628268 RepID=A0A813CJ18_9DINO|nr:unnamed protein product [Symbiodinium necroappetens]